MQTATFDGHALRYRIAGDPKASRTLVLVHAFPVGAGMFAPQEAAFPEWQVVIPALPGFDGSDLSSDASIDAYASDVLRLLDHLRVDRAVFAGVSLGGYLIFGVLRQQAGRVAGMVLADTRSPADAPEARAGRERLKQMALQSGPTAVAEEMLPKLLGESTRARRPHIADAVRRMIQGQTSAGIAAAVQVLMSRPDSTPVLSTVTVPTLVIVGREDALTPPAEMEGMAAGIAGATFVQIDEAGHLANLENPTAFNQHVAGWLRSL
jgi:pimeloyl-ACP methyl ester carboxylesterase